MNSEIQEIQFKTLFEEASESFFLIDFDGIIKEANAEGCNLLGYSKEEIIGINLTRILSKEEISRVIPTFNGLQNGKTLTDDWKLKRKDLSFFIGEVSLKKINDRYVFAIIHSVDECLNEGFQDQHNIRFRLKMDHLLEGCQILGFDWRYLYLNKVAELHNHRPNADLLGKYYNEVWPGIEKTEVYKFIKTTLEDRVSICLETEFVFPDGRHGWFNLSIQPVPEGVFILSIDITERKLVEQSLKESEEKYRLVLDNTTEWIYWQTPENKVNYISPAFEEITGYSTQEFIDNPNMTIQICHPDDLEHVKMHFDRLTSGHETGRFEFRILTKSGEVKWISHICNPLFGIDGEFLGRRAVNRNITELKRKEELLRESEIRFSKLYEKGPFGMTIVDADFKFKSVNPSLVEMFGYTEAELQQLTFIDITHADDKTKDLPNVFRLNNSEIPVYRTEKRFVRKNGEIFWASLTVTAHFNEEGKYLYNLALIDDISDKKQYRDSIEKQNALLKAIINSSSEVLIFAIDKQFKYIAYNEKHRLEMKKMWNVDIEKGSNLLDLLANKFLREKTRQNIERTWQGISFNEIEYQNNPRIYYEFFWSPIFQEGQITGTTVFIRDITEEKKAEVALRESEEKFRRVFEINPDSISISQVSDGRYISVNNGYTLLFGYAKDEVIGKTSLDVNLWNDINDRTRYVDELKQKGFIENFEVKFNRKNGEILDALVSAILIEVNNQPCILSTVKDITELKASQEALKASQELLNEVGRIAQIGGWEFSPITGESSWTEEVARIHGFDPHTPASVETSLMFYTEHSRPLIENAVKEIIEKGIPYDLELEFIDANNEKKWVRTMGQPVFKDGNIIKIHGAFQDITEKKIAEHELIKAKENAEAVSRLKTAFINNISHEIRTPLNGIIGFAQIITDPEYSEAEKIQYNKWMSESCDRLMTTMTNILDLSLLSSGNIKLRKSKVFIIPVLKNACEGFSLPCKEKSLVINLNVDSLSDDTFVFTDKEMLGRILSQLVDNAVKFTRKGEIT